MEKLLWKCIQHITKENLLFLEDLLDTKEQNDKYMTSISKNVYIGNLDDIVNKYNNIFHRTI